MPGASLQVAPIYMYLLQTSSSGCSKIIEAASHVIFEARLLVLYLC